MAEIDTSQGGGKKKGAKKASTKVDMTPMVDLGFLLITFFMLTTTMNKPKAMEVNMPDKTQTKDKKIEVKEKYTMTILLHEDDKAYWYRGMLKPDKPLEELNQTDFSDQGIRKAVLEAKKDIGSMRNKDGQLEPAIVVIIKLTDRAKYRNMVDILDEMHICDIQKYAIVDISIADETYLGKFLLKGKK